jgi:outer membrane translocation and assembly module TamA
MSRFFLFVDGGQIESKNQTIDLFRVGYGFGLRIETRLGIMGVDYGLGRGDSWMRGKVHVGLINYF